MKKTIFNTAASRLSALVAGAMLLSAASGQAGEATTNVFSFSGSLGAWWLNGWGGGSAATAYDGTQDHTGDGGGSLYLVDDYSGGSQAVNMGWIGGVEWGGAPYDLTQWTNITFWVKWDTANSTLPIDSFNASPGDQGWQIYGSTANNGNWITLGQVTIPDAASNGWAQVNLPIDPLIPGITASYTFGFKKYVGSGLTGVAAMWVDDITFQGDTTLVVPPPTVLAPHKAVAGLNLTAASGPYNRENIQTASGLDESFLSGDPTYSFTIQQGVNGTAGAQFQNHIFLAPSPGTENDPDWTEPNVIFMDLESTSTGGTSWEFRYKTNLPSGNNMCYNNGGLTITLTNAGSGYTTAPTVSLSGDGSGISGGAAASITAQIDPTAGTVTNLVVSNNWGYVISPSAVVFTGGGGSGAGASVVLPNGNGVGVGALATLVESNITTGTWTLSVSGGNTFTMTTPSGQTTNVVLDPTVAALFTAPVTAYFGCQAGNTAGVGQLSILSNVTITGTANPVNDTFKNDSAVNTNIWTVNAVDPTGVQLIPGATPYVWVNWTVPATGYSLQTGSSLSSFADTTPFYQAQFGTVFGALVPQASGNQFYRLIKRVPYQLQVLLPGQTNAPDTVLGYTGTPTPISVSGQGLTTTTVTVNMCDATWHIVNNSDSVLLSTSDGGAFLPSTNPLGMVNGTATFSDPNGILFQTQGPQTVTAVDQSNPSILSNTSAAVTVGP